MWGRQPPSLHLTRVPDVTLIRVKWEKFNCQNLTIFLTIFFYENWFFWTFIFSHFCKYFQYWTTYLSLQYLIFCVQMSGFYWIWACFDKSKTKPVIPQRPVLFLMIHTLQPNYKMCQYFLFHSCIISADISIYFSVTIFFNNFCLF